MDLPVLIGIDRAGLVGADGETHHGVFDIGILRPLPNLILAQPCDAQEARNMIATALHQNHPFAIRYPRGEVDVRNIEKAEVIPLSWKELYVPETIRAAVISYGPDVLKISEKARINDLPVLVVNARFFKPLDLACIRRIAALHVPVFVYETDMKASGLSSAILESCCDEGISMPLKRYGIGDEYIQHGAASLLKKEAGFDLNLLYDDILKTVQ